MAATRASPVGKLDTRAGLAITSERIITKTRTTPMVKTTKSFSRNPRSAAIPDIYSCCPMPNLWKLSQASAAWVCSAIGCQTGGRNSRGLTEYSKISNWLKFPKPGWSFTWVGFAFDRCQFVRRSAANGQWEEKERARPDFGVTGTAPFILMPRSPGPIELLSLLLDALAFLIEPANGASSRGLIGRRASHRPSPAEPGVSPFFKNYLDTPCQTQAWNIEFFFNSINLADLYTGSAHVRPARTR